MKSALQTAWLMLLAVTSARAADEWEARGRVVDEAGGPVAKAAVAPFWSANGTGKHPDGTAFDLKKDKDARAFWGHLGQMEPRVRNPATTGANGSFAIKLDSSTHTIMAMDPARSRGGIAVVPKGQEHLPIEIRLGPLVRLRTRFEGPTPGKVPWWTHVYVMVPEDPTRPLDSCRLVSCGSFEARLDVALPPGRYTLAAYSQYPDREVFEGDLIPDKTIALRAGTPLVDLGTLRLTSHRPDRQTLEAQSKAEGTWDDYSRHFGEPPPRWHATDARGVRKDAQITDFRGKWVLIEFWGLSCRPCLSRHLPKLMRFYEDHAAQRDQFEIVSICIDIDGELKSMADLDRALAPIVKHVWSGRTLPFPILLDPTFKTWERFGLPGLGMAILIDPEGRLVKGDETTLAEKLKGKVH